MKLPSSQGYGPFFGVVLLILAVFRLLAPFETIRDHWRACLLAFCCGLLVGVTEIISRYRDEPFHACRSPYGLVYAFANGALSMVALLIIYRYPGQFAGLAGDGFLVAMAAGFGAAAVMRAKVAVIKGSDEKDISIGPDQAIRILLRAVDKNVDRFRAERRQDIVVRSLPRIRLLGENIPADAEKVRMAGEYLLASTMAFQNLDDALKQELRETFDGYERKALPVDLKFLAMGFVFLTLVGEAHYEKVLENAASVRLPAGPVPGQPAAPAAPQNPRP